MRDSERPAVLMLIPLQRGGGLARVIIRAAATLSPRLSACEDHIALKSSCLSPAAASFILPPAPRPVRTASSLSCCRQPEQEAAALQAT